MFYSFLIQDDRYSVPALRMAFDYEFKGLTPQELACQTLKSNPHYQRVEVWCDKDLVLAVNRGDPSPE